MKYYALKNSTAKEIGKEYPQTDGMGDGYSFSAVNSISNLPHLEMPDFTPNLDYFNLDKKAKLTDFISTALINAEGFIVNDRVKNVLDNFNLAPHRFYPAKLLHNNKFYTNYFWLHFLT